MPESCRDREILLKLADQLPDEILKQLFSDTVPEAVRQALRRRAGTIRSPAASPCPDRTTGKNVGPAGQSPSLKEETKSCMLYTDGASRGNPGEAGAGAVLLDGDGRELGTRAVHLGQCTNNAAEYQALLHGLDLAREFGCDDLRIFLDSELIVRQINGQYRVKNAQLKPLYNEVMTRLARLARWRVQHVPRSENARADQLANQGIDGRTEQ